MPQLPVLVHAFIQVIHDSTSSDQTPRTGKVHLTDHVATTLILNVPRNVSADRLGAEAIVNVNPLVEGYVPKILWIYQELILIAGLSRE